jgi:hypothetical protein
MPKLPIREKSTWRRSDILFPFQCGPSPPRPPPAGWTAPEPPPPPQPAPQRETRKASRMAEFFHLRRGGRETEEKEKATTYRDPRTKKERMSFRNSCNFVQSCHKLFLFSFVVKRKNKLASEVPKKKKLHEKLLFRHLKELWLTQWDDLSTASFLEAHSYSRRTFVFYGTLTFCFGVTANFSAAALAALATAYDDDDDYHFHNGRENFHRAAFLD